MEEVRECVSARDVILKKRPRRTRTHDGDRSD